MTPARKSALQWFHDRGEVEGMAFLQIPVPDRPAARIINNMRRDGQLEITRRGFDDFLSLTDKGRRMLHGDPE